METNKLITEGLINSLKLTKKTYSIRGLICVDKKDIFKRDLYYFFRIKILLR